MTAGREVSESNPGTRVLDRFFGIRDFKAKTGRDSGLKVCVRVRMPEITPGITRFQEVLVRDYGIEKPYWGPIAKGRLGAACTLQTARSLLTLDGHQKWRPRLQECPQLVLSC